MEEFEGLEKKSHAKGSNAKTGKKQGKTKSTVSPVAEFPGVQSQASPSALQNLLNSPIPAGLHTLQQSAIPPATSPPVPAPASFPAPPSSAVADSLKLKLNLSAMVASQNPLVSPPGQLPPPPPSKSEKKAKAKASKKSKGTSDLFTPISSSEQAGSQVKPEIDVGIKLKLKIPPGSETAKSPLQEQITQSLQQLSPPGPKV